MTMQWKEVLLGELVEIKHGYAYKGEYFVDEKTNNILLTPGNFAIGGGFQWGKLKFYNGPVPDDYILNEGDLVVTMTDLSKAADTLGYSAIIPHSEKILLHNQRIGKVIRKTSSVDYKYLNYQLRTRAYRNEILASATGSTVKHTSPTKICAYRFKLPPLNEQQDIASVLSVIDDKIENNLIINEKLEEIARAIFKSWFIDFDPVYAKVSSKTSVCMNAETTKMFPSSFGDDGLPIKWEQRKISEFANVILGGTPSRNNPSYWGGNIPWINSGAVNKFRILEATELITKDGLKNSSTKLLPINTTVIAITGATLGQISYLEIESCANQSVVGVISNKDYASEWLYLSFLLNIDRLINLQTGGAQQHINKNDVLNFKVIYPTEEIISSFSGIVRPMFKKIANNLRENQTLKKLRDTLLPKLMSGEIRVKDAEREVEAAV